MPDMTYRGVQDPNYVRPPGTEFPKIVYRKNVCDPKGYSTRLVRTQEEQDALAPSWLTDAASIHKLLDPIHKAQYADSEDVAPAAGEAPKPAKKSRKAPAAKPAAKPTKETAKQKAQDKAEAKAEKKAEAKAEKSW